MVLKKIANNVLKTFSLIFLLNHETPLYSKEIPTPNIFNYIEGVTEDHRSRMKNHPGDYPFPTDMTFCFFADHKILPSTKSFDPNSVKKGDTIFLMDDYLPWFVKEIHPRIKEPYILISNDSDGKHPRKGFVYNTLIYDSKVAAWFCKNMILSKHPKIFQIPIGQNIIYWGNFPEKELLIDLSKKNNEKKYLLYMNMQLASHKSRPIIANLFEEKNYCFSRINYEAPGGNSLLRNDFYKELAEAHFVVAPRGYGPDTVRFWEAITLDVIPIVKHSPLDDLYLDLPVVFVHEWEEINENFLNNKWNEIKNKNYSKEKVYFNYWKEKINDIQNQVRNNSNTFSKIDATMYSKEDLSKIKKIIKNHKVKNVIVKGYVQSLRPFQLAEIFSKKKIYILDPWMNIENEERIKYLNNFTKKSIVDQKNVEILPYSVKLDSLAKKSSNKKTSFFLDLYYHRHSFYRDFSNIYVNIPKGTMIVGNLSQDPYVKDIIHKLEKKFLIHISFKENFWYYIKT